MTVAVQDAEARARLVTALFSAVWGGGGGLMEPERLVSTVFSAGLDAPALIAAARTPEVKDQVRLNTDELLALEGFGVPTIVADGELFFGVDSLGHLERFLRGEDPLTPAELERLRTLPVGASRI
jgi:2-hydroxychromene-2-carboxylate isomerase